MRKDNTCDIKQDNSKPCLALINWRTSGRLVTMPEPRGKKSLHRNINAQRQ